MRNYDLIKNKYLNNNKADVLKHVEAVADIAAFMIQGGIFCKIPP